MTAPSRRVMCSKWFIPGLCVVLGGGVFLAMAIGGQIRLGAESFGIMVGFGVVVLLAGRSETIRGLRGDGRDERFRQMDIEATALAGLVVVAALIVSWLVAVGERRSGAPYDWLCAIAGIAYIAGIVLYRLRR